MISVSDPHMVYDYTPYASDSNGVKAILPLCFADADEPGPDIYGFETEESDLMSFGDAEKIVQRFLRKQALQIVLVLVPVNRSHGRLPLKDTRPGGGKQVSPAKKALFLANRRKLT